MTSASAPPLSYVEGDQIGRRWGRRGATSLVAQLSVPSVERQPPSPGDVGKVFEARVPRRMTSRRSIALGADAESEPRDRPGTIQKTQVKEQFVR